MINHMVILLKFFKVIFLKFQVLEVTKSNSRFLKDFGCTQNDIQFHLFSFFNNITMVDLTAVVY